MPVDETQRELITAEAYLERYEPGVLDLMLDRVVALASDGERAYAIATRLGHPTIFDDAGVATTEEVWQLVYP